VPVLGEFAQILHVNLRNSGFPGTPHDTVVQRPSEEFRENGD